MTRVLTVFGTRPEAVKMAPVCKALAADPAIDARICVTAQHRDMLDRVLNLFGLIPDYDLDVMRPEQDLTDITCSVLTGLRPILKAWQPDLLLVHGDTSTTVSAALAAFYAGIRVGHVEAGLRTGNLRAPWPEEANRKITSTVTDLHFAPTQTARANLVNEGVEPKSIVVTGNTVIDALNFSIRRLASATDQLEEYSRQYPFLSSGRRVILVTGHRRENLGHGLEQICLALKAIAARGDVEVVYPVHPNPSVRRTVTGVLGGVQGVHLLQPLDYLPFVHLMSKAHLIVTDSGGIQEEAPSLGIPVLLTRETTERPEGVASGTVKLVGVSTAAVETSVNLLLDDPDSYGLMAKAANPFGDGKASHRIVTTIRERLSREPLAKVAWT